MSAQDAPVALVTGGGSGIGAATARALAAEGLRVVVTDVRARSAEDVARSIADAGGTAMSRRMDVSDEREVTAVFADVSKAWDTPVQVAHAAGVLHFAPALETTVASFDDLLRVNLTGTFIVDVVAAKALRSSQQHGAIVNVSSIHAQLSEPSASAYTAAKGGVEAMSRTFASEWASLGIRVNCVRPGATRTALTEAIYTPQVLAALAQRIPMQRPATAEEIANALVYLLSPRASYITGTTLDVDGGYVMNGSLPGTAYVDDTTTVQS